MEGHWFDSFCCSVFTLFENEIDRQMTLLTILRVLVTIVTGHGDVHLIAANRRNGSSSNTWSSLSS